MIKFFKKNLILILFLLLLLPIKSFAASVSFAVPEAVSVGDNFSLVVSVDTGGELINSADITINYPPDLVDFSGYQDDDTMIKFWVGAPSAKDGQIHFSGIIPGGVLGLYDAKKSVLAPVPLVRLLFTAKKEGNVKLSFTQTQILKSDGRGTVLAHTEQDGEILIKNNANSIAKNINNHYDTSLPEKFDVTFIESHFFSRTPAMLVFSTSDKDSGIKLYKMQIGGGPWQEVKSPQPVSKSIFSTNVTVRAYDFFGNFRESSVTIPGLISNKVLIIMFVLLLLCLFVYRVLKYRT